MFDQPPSERLPEINFLDPNLEITFSFEEETALALPDITPEDVESGQERYVVLIGNLVRNSVNDVTVILEDVWQQAERRGYWWQEEKLEITGVKFAELLDYAKEACEQNPELVGQMLIGELHTHPVIPEPGDADPADPSPADLSAIADYHDAGFLTNRPFIFGIASLKQGETHYAFYRLINDNGNYAFERIEKK